MSLKDLPKDWGRNEPNVNYDFELVTPDTFVLGLSTYASNSFLERVYRSSKKGTGRKGLPVDLKDVPSVEIESKYFNLIRLGVTKPLRVIAREVAADGINIVRSSISKAYLMRTKGKSQQWLIFVEVKGDCEDRRGKI